MKYLASLKTIAIEVTRYAALAGVVAVVAWWYYCSFIAECRCIDPERSDFIYIPAEPAYYANIFNMKVSAETCDRINERRYEMIAHEKGRLQQTMRNIIVPKNFVDGNYIASLKEHLEKAGVKEISFKPVDDAIFSMEDEDRFCKTYYSSKVCYRHLHLQQKLERMEIITGEHSKKNGCWDWITWKLHPLFCSNCGGPFASTRIKFSVGKGHPFILSKDAYTEGLRKDVKFVSVYVSLADNPLIEKYGDTPLSEEKLDELLIAVKTAAAVERLPLPIHIRDTWTGRVRYLITPYGKTIVSGSKVEQSHE